MVNTKEPGKYRKLKTSIVAGMGAYNGTGMGVAHSLIGKITRPKYGWRPNINHLLYMYMYLDQRSHVSKR